MDAIGNDNAKIGDISDLLKAGKVDVVFLAIEPVRAALSRLGLATAGQLPAGERDRLVAVLAKAEASHDGRLRGHRHTMLDDSDISSTRHARGFVCGALAVSAFL
mgnify:CR=1 FL=1